MDAEQQRKLHNIAATVVRLPPNKRRDSIGPNALRVQVTESVIGRSVTVLNIAFCLISLIIIDIL